MVIGFVEIRYYPITDFKDFLYTLSFPAYFQTYTDCIYQTYVHSFLKEIIFDSKQKWRTVNVHFLTLNVVAKFTTKLLIFVLFVVAVSKVFFNLKWYSSLYRRLLNASLNALIYNSLTQYRIEYNYNRNDTQQLKKNRY